MNDAFPPARPFEPEEGDPPAEPAEPQLEQPPGQPRPDEPPPS